MHERATIVHDMALVVAIAIAEYGAESEQAQDAERALIRKVRSWQIDGALAGETVGRIVDAALHAASAFVQSGLTDQ